MRTYVYIDGFNFYHGAVKGTPYKWLDFMALFRLELYPHYQIELIKYFTAYVSRRPHDPQQPDRQKIYLKALRRHLGNRVEIILGQFRSHQKLVTVTTPQGDQIQGSAIRTEEKGSDVNLAVHLVNDAWHDRYDSAVVVSNDSDVAAALKIVRDERNKEVVLLTPPKFQRQRSKELKKVCTRSMTIRNSNLAASQLPDPIPGTNLHKPAVW